MSQFEGILQLKKPKEIEGIGVFRTKILKIWSFEDDGEILTIFVQDKKSAKVIKVELLVSEVKLFDVTNGAKLYEIISEEKPIKSEENENIGLD